MPGEFGRWLLDYELPRRGIDVSTFARMIGVETSTIYRWRTNMLPRRSSIGRIALALDMSYEEVESKMDF